MKRLCVCAAAIALSACAAKNGTNGNACSVVSNADGSATITCTNGTSTTIEPGQIGATGTTGAMGHTGTSGGNCTVAESNGTATITCPGASTSVSNGTPPCTTLDGDLDVSSPLDIAAFQAAGCTTIDGNLIITSSAVSASGFQTLQSVVTDLSGLSNLTTVTGYVDIEGDGSSEDDPEDFLQATSLHGLQNLAEVDGSFIVDATTWLTDTNLASLATTGGFGVGVQTGNAALLSVEAPALATDGEDLVFIYNPLQTSLTLGPLTSMNGSVIIGADPVLTTLDLSQLTSIGSDHEIEVLQNNALTTLNLSGLIAADGLFITANPALTTLSLTALTTLGNNPSAPGPYAAFGGLSALTELDLPVLTVGSLQIEDNALMTTVNAPVLASSGFLDIETNAVLSTVTLPDLATIGSLTVDNTVATSLSFPALTTVTDALALDDNADLSSVTFSNGGLTVTTSAEIDNDPELCPFLPITGVTVTASGDGVCL